MTSLCVAVPTLNRAKYIDRFLTEIRPVIPQIKASVEVLILDSASVDDTRSVIERHGLPYVRYMRQRTQQPNWESHLVCPYLTNADLIMWCGDDDLPVAEGINFSIGQASDFNTGSLRDGWSGSFYGVCEKADDGNNEVPKSGGQKVSFKKGDYETALNFFLSNMHHVELGVFRTKALRNVSVPRKIFLGYWLFASLLSQGDVYIHSVLGVIHRLRNPSAGDTNDQWKAAVDKLDQLRAGYEYLIWRAMTHRGATQLSPETKNQLAIRLTQRFAHYAAIAQRVAHDQGDKQAALEFAMRACLWSGDASQVAEFEQATSSDRLWRHADAMANAAPEEQAIDIDANAMTQSLRVC